MSLLTAILLGILFGITEFLPLSSSGHFAIVQAFLKTGYSAAEHAFFDVLLQIGAIASVMLVFGRDIKTMLRESVNQLIREDEIGSAERGGRLSPNVRLTVFVICGAVPLIAALPFINRVAMLASNTVFIAFAMLITAAIIYVTGLLEPGKKTGKSITFADSVVVGLAQAASVIPGLSRTGTTIAAGFTRGFKRDFAIKFSFLLSVPYLLLATVMKLFSAVSAGVEWSLLFTYLVGAVFSTAAGYFAILCLRYMLTNGKLKYLAYYTGAVGVVTLVLTFIL